MSSDPQNSFFEKPFALSMGPQRAGTTWLDRYLRARGDICLPAEVKETFFFDRNFDRGGGFYKSHFHPRPKDKLMMEITATSFDCPDAPQRVYDVFGPNVRMICPLRHPVVRSYSLYLHYLRYGIVSGSLREAAKDMPQIIESSHYHQHLARWFDLFGRESITIVFQEDLEHNQDLFLRQVCAGLDIPYKKPAENISGKYNVTSYARFGLLTRTAQNAADWLRAHRFYKIINIAKAAGIKKLIFGAERPDANSTNIPEDDLAWLQDELSQDIEKLESFLDCSIVQWQAENK